MAPQAASLSLPSRISSITTTNARSNPKSRGDDAEHLGRDLSIKSLARRGDEATRCEDAKKDDPHDASHDEKHEQRSWNGVDDCPHRAP